MSTATVPSAQARFLQVHHVVKNRDHLAGDLAFLAFGILLCLVGWRTLRSAVPVRMH